MSIDQLNLDMAQFLLDIDPYKEAYKDIKFNYVAIEKDGYLNIYCARLYFRAGKNDTENRLFRSANIKAGECSIPCDLDAFLDQIKSGKIRVQDSELLFPGLPVLNSKYTAYHPEGIQAQTKINVLSLYGIPVANIVKQPQVDWELKSGSTPYNDIADLLVDFKLGPADKGSAKFELVSYRVMGINLESHVDGETAHIIVDLAHDLATDSVRIGYRTTDKGSVTARGSIEGSAIKWSDQGEFLQGVAEVKVPLAASVQCIASYAGVTQHYWWIADPKTSQNVRRASYSAFDLDLETLSTFLSGEPNKGSNKGGDFEWGVSWLLWMHGFSVSHLGQAAKMKDAPDIIAATPQGRFAVVECTTGLLKTDNKLPLLISRTEEVRRKLDASGNNHLSVLAVMITSKSKNDILADLEQAEKLGVLVMTQEDILEMISGTVMVPNADNLFTAAEQRVTEAKTKHMSTVANSNKTEP